MAGPVLSNIEGMTRPYHPNAPALIVASPSLCIIMYIMVRKNAWIILLALAALLLLIAGCRQDPTPPPTLAPGAAQTPLPPAAPEEEDTAPPETAPPTEEIPTPTPTPPLAALVNDQPILLTVYEQELARYEQAKAALGRELEPDYETIVLDTLIEQQLIEQAAAEAGITLSPDLVNEKVAELRAEAGSPENFAAWLEANQWSEEEFHDALRREMILERMVEYVTADTPHAVEQVRARYIQVDDAALAQSLLEQIQDGADFAALAQAHSLDRTTGQHGGDLDYFPRGGLLAPEIEEAAFALAAGEVSELIAVTGDNGQTTYYLVQKIARDPNRPLDPRMRYNLLSDAFEAWLAGLWTEAEIIRFVNSG